MSALEGAIAVTRFGIGAKPGEIKAASSDPRGWLKAQIKASAAITPAGDLKSAKDVILARQEEAMTMAGPGAPGVKKDDAAQQALRKMIQQEARDGLQREIDARARQAAVTTTPFAERWARFWSNHFTVSARNAQMIGLVGPYEREAIRPHVFGSFEGLLAKATYHQGMLTYLDAARSYGPSTEMSQRRKLGLNENLAREILELHTMGVGSGYSQADIIEFAKSLTGWTISNQQTQRLAGQGGPNRPRQVQRAAQRAGAQQAFNVPIGEVMFVEALHEPGQRTVLGKTYSGAKEQSALILTDLARHPKTAQHIARKLARHFVSDDPPASAVAKIAAAFTRTRGDLAEVARTIVDLDEAWKPQQAKFKSPEELLVSVARATPLNGAERNRVLGLMPDNGATPDNSGDDADDKSMDGGEARSARAQRRLQQQQNQQMRQMQQAGQLQRGFYNALAQQPFRAPSPAGWPDDATSWSGSDAVMKRLEWSNAVARRLQVAMSPNDFLDMTLGPLASETTRKAVSRAESAEQGFTLALMSPEFQRR